SPALRVGLTEDLYVTLTRIDSSGVSLDLFRNPLQWLLWLGGFVVVGGGAWALAVRRPSRQLEAALDAP
ncbi:MAG: hypothetical protein OES13_12225, partial [Acidimicrobiia bacterium]|nr:hypothetical protein [Acidimicrobiia bacterium]